MSAANVREAGRDTLWQPPSAVALTSSPWPNPPPTLELEAGRVQVWCVSLERPPLPLDALGRLLDATERERAGRFRRDEDRRGFVARRGLLRVLLGRYLVVPPAAVPLAVAPGGKPVLAGRGHAAWLSFSLASSHGLALYAFARGRALGVDLERARPLERLELLEARVCSARERRALRRLPPEERLAGFYRCWTRKEAYLKALGVGLRRPLDQVTVSVGREERPRLLDAAWAPGDAARWSLHHLAAVPDFVGALAVWGDAWELSTWAWRAGGAGRLRETGCGVVVSDGALPVWLAYASEARLGRRTRVSGRRRSSPADDWG